MLKFAEYVTIIIVTKKIIIRKQFSQLDGFKCSCIVQICAAK